jgi:hypothetical protein
VLVDGRQPAIMRANRHPNKHCRKGGRRAMA